MAENSPLRDGAMQVDPEVDVDDDAIFEDPPNPLASQPEAEEATVRDVLVVVLGVVLVETYGLLYSVRPPSGRGLL